MRWIRSWPAEPPAGRPQVVDDLARLVMTGYDYAGLAGLDDDVALVEWDVAIDPYDAQRFEWRCQSDPRQVRVAAYRLADAAGLRWAHRRLVQRNRQPGGWEWVERWVEPTDRDCD